MRSTTRSLKKIFKIAMQINRNYSANPFLQFITFKSTKHITDSTRLFVYAHAKPNMSSRNIKTKTHEKKIGEIYELLQLNKFFITNPIIAPL